MRKFRPLSPTNALVTAKTTIAPHDPTARTFNFALALPGRASSRHSERAYFRWVDEYLVAIAGMKPTTGDARLQRMMNLPAPLMKDILTPSQLRAWLGLLSRQGHGKQGISQARASIVTLASLLAEAEIIEDYVSAGIGNVRPPNAEDGQRPGRWLALEQIHALMSASQRIATTDEQARRNKVVLTMLCTMALRREELSAVRWGDLSLQNNRVVLKVHGKGRKIASIDVPRSVVNAIESWRACVDLKTRTPPPESPLLRRLWKGGRVSRYALTPDGIWLIVGDAALAAGLDHVAPHDLRRSVAGALQASGVPIEKISRLLRHANVAVTERYLSRLPQQNEGGVLMSDILGLEDDF